MVDKSLSGEQTACLGRLKGAPLPLWKKPCSHVRLAGTSNGVFTSAAIHKKLCSTQLVFEMHFLFNTYSMKTYALFHFEHKNDVTTIAKFLYRAARVAL